MGSWGARGVHSGDPGVPDPEGYHRWCELDVVEGLGTGARIGPGDLGGLELSVVGLVGLGGGVVGGPQGSGPVSSIVVQCADLQAW